MKKNYLLIKYYILTLLFLTSLTGYSQSYKCASDDIHNEMLQKNAQYRQSTEAFEDLMQAGGPANLRTAAGTIYRIPVVFHIMHKGEAVGVGTNISDAAVQECVSRLNQMYRKVAGTKGAENASATDIEIEFALAVRDPNGNCTNGINRVNMSSNATYMASGVYRKSAGITDTELKATPGARWDQTKYYNIWVVYEIDNNENGSGIQGYAYFASSHGQSFDGSVMIKRAITNSGSITLPHELGHALNLYHTFEGDNNGVSCPANANCSTEGDRVCDTPPHIRSSDCSVGTNSCDGGTSTALHRNNYMDYSADACQNMFSAGQKPRMTAAITTTRKSFLASQGNLSLVPVSTAGVDFISNTSFGCSGTKVAFTDKSTCIPNVYIVSDPFPNINFAWTVTNNAGVTLTSTLQNPEFILTTAGNYDVTLSITSPAGTSSKTVTKMISIAASAIAATCKPVSNSTSTLPYGIFSVKMAGINHASGSTSDDKASGFTDANGYADLSCSEGANLNPNTTYSLTIGGATSTGLSENIAAYIDYNNDGDFNDKGDTITTWLNHTGGKDSTISFKTPASPVTGKALRFRVIECRSSETPAPCMTTTRGQCHDFAVYFIPATICTQPTPALSVTTGTATSCVGTKIVLSSSLTPSGGVYEWYKGGVVIAGQTGSVLTMNAVAAADAGDYEVLVKSSTACATASAKSTKVTLTVNVIPSAPSISGTSTLCAGANLSLTASSTTSGVIYTWTKPAASTATASANTITKTGAGATEAGNYSVTATVNGCTSASSANTTVVVNATPAVPTITGTAVLCVGDNMSLTASSTTSGVTYNWIKPVNSTAVANQAVMGKTGVAATEAGSYSATATSSGCTSASSASKSVLVNPIPAAPTLSGTTNLCVGGNLSLTASSTTTGVTYTWTKPAGSTATASANMMNKTGLAATEAGNYAATAIANGCVSISSPNKTVVVNQVPAVTSAITGVTTPCVSTQNYSVTTVSGVTYVWDLSGGGALMPSNSSTATINWTTIGGPYSLSVTPGNACGPGPVTSVNVNVSVCTGNVDVSFQDQAKVWINLSAGTGDLTLNISEGTLSKYFSKVSVYNASGTEVLSGSLREALQVKILHLHSLQAGVYQVVVYSNTDKAPVLLRFVK